MFWLIAIYLMDSSNGIMVICMDGFAALMSWAFLVGLSKYFIREEGELFIRCKKRSG